MTAQFGAALKAARLVLLTLTLSVRMIVSSLIFLLAHFYAFVTFLPLLVPSSSPFPYLLIFFSVFLPDLRHSPFCNFLLSSFLALFLRILSVFLFMI
jgi:hypothetical protein